MNLLTVKEAAPVLKKRRAAAVYDLVYANTFPPGVVVRIGRSVYLEEEALKEWVSKGGSLAEQGGNNEAQTQKRDADADTKRAVVA